MELSVYRAADPDERARWLAAWSELPPGRRDAYFLPGYAHAAHRRGEALCAVARSGERLWLCAFLRAEIPGGEGLCDVETPYGYGGPVVNDPGEDPTFLAGCWSAWSAWCRSAGVVAEFTRFHPLLENHRWADPGTRVLPNRTTVPLELDRYPVAVFEDAYFRRHRNMIRKAERDGCRFETKSAAGEMAWFAELYARTQDRLGASEETRFGREYFEELASGLGERAWLGLVHTASGELGAAVLVIQGETLAHCHLMGDRRVAGSGGVTNLVYHGIALEAARRGLRTLHMGGGRTADEDDSLFRFKVGLSPERATFRIGTRCHDPEAYERLARAWEARHGARPVGYFLFYRLAGEARA
jgi:hypothetical protein